MGESRPLGEQERLLNYLHAYGGLIVLQVLHVRGRLDPPQVRAALAWSLAGVRVAPCYARFHTGD